MQKVIIASKNPVKIKATVDAFERMFPGETFEFEGVDVPSGVSEQPVGDDEIMTGSENRMNAAHEAHPDADYWVGIEGGVEDHSGGMVVFAWMVVRDATGRVGRGRSGTFFLPPKVAELVAGGMELGPADDQVFGRTNSKQANGAIGLLTDDVVTRSDYYTEAIILALVPFKNPEYYV